MSSPSKSRKEEAEKQRVLAQDIYLQMRLCYSANDISAKYKMTVADVMIAYRWGKALVTVREAADRVKFSLRERSAAMRSRQQRIDQFAANSQRP
jgi:hypothetical protein